MATTKRSQGVMKTVGKTMKKAGTAVARTAKKATRAVTKAVTGNGRSGSSRTKKSTARSRSR